MSDPATAEDHAARTQRNHSITGYGLETTTHMPCPFCAAADFLVFTILAVNEALLTGATCKECGRGMRAEMRPDEPGIALEMVQICGPPPPAYLPRMRRFDQ